MKGRSSGGTSAIVFLRRIGEEKSENIHTLFYSKFFLLALRYIRMKPKNNRYF